MKEAFGQAKQNSVEISLREPDLDVGHGESHVPSGPDPLERFAFTKQAFGTFEGWQEIRTEEVVLVELL